MRSGSKPSGADQDKVRLFSVASGDLKSKGGPGTATPVL